MPRESSAAARWKSSSSWLGFVASETMLNRPEPNHFTGSNTPLGSSHCFALPSLRLLMCWFIVLFLNKPRLPLGRRGGRMPGSGLRPLMSILQRLTDLGEVLRRLECLRPFRSGFRLHLRYFLRIAESFAVRCSVVDAVRVGVDGELRRLNNRRLPRPAFRIRLERADPSKLLLAPLVAVEEAVRVGPDASRVWSANVPTGGGWVCSPLVALLLR